MEEHWLRAVEAWHDFYIYVGTAASTLMGLVFVVVSLGPRSVASEQGARAARAFYTPIVAFFATAIAVSMLMLTPGSAPNVIGELLGAIAVLGLVYMVRSGAYKQWRAGELGLDDWIFYVGLPFLSYVAIAVGAAGIWQTMSFGLYTLAIVMVLLVFVGIRNAWDLVIYIAQRQGRPDE